MFTRRQQAQQTRENAANLAANRPHPPHLNNAEEHQYRKTTGVDVGGKNPPPSYIANFTKGLPHDGNGLLTEARDYEAFVKAIDSGNEQDFASLRLGPGPFTDTDEYRDFANGEPVHGWSFPQNLEAGTAVRAWESQGAGLTFDLEGPDAQAVTMPPAPRLDSQELIAEMAEVYWMAILRDVPFLNYSPGINPDAKVKAAQDSLARFYWFANESTNLLQGDDTSPDSLARRRVLVENRSDEVSLNKMFRGVAKGDDIGPYISQFLLIGNTGINGNDNSRNFADGFISYGSIKIDQRVRYARPHENFMTDWNEWLDVQDGADVRGRENYVAAPQAYRFITTPRDLATYVHYDALYEAYLNACLALLGMGAPFDPGIPFQNADFRDKQQGFAHFGGPHILSLVTEVATRALKAVRFQKFNVHRRLRPEGVGGWLYQLDKNNLQEVQVLQNMLNAFSGSSGLTPNIRALSNNGLLLPMAFPEGSPMHPAYGAGHATVAGACVTILKAFFDTGWELPLRNGSQPIAYQANCDGSQLEAINLDSALTVEGELNKLAANISIGRNWAGVHYYSDYIESLRLGEEIAIGILEEQKLTYGENFSMTIPLFDGGAIRI